MSNAASLNNATAYRQLNASDLPPMRKPLMAAPARKASSTSISSAAPDEFVPAQRLYESEGFVRCGPFEGYTDDPFSVFMTRTL